MDKMNRRQLVRRLAHTAVGIGVGAALLPTLGGRSQSAQAAEPARRRLRAAQIGTAHFHALGKMRAVRSLPELYDVVAVAENNPALRHTLAEHKEYAGLKWLEVEALLELPELDVVLIETDNVEAPEMARRALVAGANVHLDKPGANDHAEFATMRRLAEEHGLIVQMGYMFRHLPIMEFLFQIVRDGWLGEVLEIESSLGKNQPSGGYQTLLQLPSAMLDIGCHLIDLVFTILGKPQAIHAVSTPSAAGRAAGAEDNLLAVFEYQAASAAVRSNLVDPFGIPRRRFSVVGSEGTIELAQLESGNGRLMLEHDRSGYAAGIHDLVMPYRYGRFGAEFIALAAAIQGGPALPWDANHDIAVHAASLRAGGVAVPGVWAAE